MRTIRRPEAEPWLRGNEISTSQLPDIVVFPHPNKNYMFASLRSSAIREVKTFVHDGVSYRITGKIMPLSSLYQSIPLEFRGHGMVVEAIAFIPDQKESLQENDQSPSR